MRGAGVKPYPYQQQQIDGALALWQQGHRRIANVLGTGGGKTVIFSHVAKLALAAGKPALVLAHRKELIEQAADKLRQVNPGARIGIFKGKLKQYRAEIVVASVQTACTEAGLNLLKAAGFGLIVVDETHHAVADSYMRVLRHLGAFDEAGPLVLGSTATLDRADGLALGALFEAVVDPVIGLRELIKMGYLVPPRGVRVKIAGLDLGRVRSTAGDFDNARLAAAMHDALAPAAIARAYVEHAAGRPAIAFLPTIGFSVEQVNAFAEVGVRAVHLDGTTSDDERTLQLKRHRAGELDVLCNVGLFTEGTDLPYVSAVILGRPTQSPTLYTQMVGRGVRMHPGKRDCIILDVSGVTSKHRLATLANLDGADRAEDLDDELALYEAEWTDEQEPADAEPAPPPEPKEPEEITGADGPLDHELVDLFGSAHAAWLQSAKMGTWFLPAGPDTFIWLGGPYGDRQQYDICWISKDGKREGTLVEGMEIGYAMAWGEEYVERTPMWGGGRDAKWRSLKPTAKLLAQARTLGVDRSGPRGEVFDRVAIAEASRLLD
jgi:superfamily II DNA or RNA helicase